GRGEVPLPPLEAPEDLVGGDHRGRGRLLVPVGPQAAGADADAEGAPHAVPAEGRLELLRGAFAGADTAHVVPADAAVLDRGEHQGVSPADGMARDLPAQGLPPPVPRLALAHVVVDPQRDVAAGVRLAVARLGEADEQAGRRVALQAVVP